MDEIIKAVWDTPTSQGQGDKENSAKELEMSGTEKGHQGRTYRKCVQEEGVLGCTKRCGELRKGSSENPSLDLAAWRSSVTLKNAMKAKNRCERIQESETEDPELKKQRALFQGLLERKAET